MFRKLQIVRVKMKYIIKFQKKGVICYISHLDMLKVFKRAFKRAGVGLAYSRGFNPHPKIGFAQPLSLGYEGLDEYVEFEVSPGCEGMGEQGIISSLREMMPEGLELISIVKDGERKKTLAAEVTAAEYTIKVPVPHDFAYKAREMWDMYMDRDAIMVSKRQKKKKNSVPVDIKPKIREITFKNDPGYLQIDTVIDAGSESNLSPELIISSVCEMLGITTPRSEIEVTRNKIHFKE